jgi:hypothetical protein
MVTALAQEAGDWRRRELGGPRRRRDHGGPRRSELGGRQCGDVDA